MHTEEDHTNKQIVVKTSESPQPKICLHVSVAQWANALSELQCAARPDWLETCDDPGSIPRRGVGVSLLVGLIVGML